MHRRTGRQPELDRTPGAADRAWRILQERDRRSARLRRELEEKPPRPCRCATCGAPCNACRCEPERTPGGDLGRYRDPDARREAKRIHVERAREDGRCVTCRRAPANGGGRCDGCRAYFARQAAYRRRTTLILHEPGRTCEHGAPAPWRCPTCRRCVRASLTDDDLGPRRGPYRRRRDQGQTGKE